MIATVHSLHYRTRRDHVFLDQTNPQDIYHVELFQRFRFSRRELIKTFKLKPFFLSFFTLSTVRGALLVAFVMFAHTLALY